MALSDIRNQYSKVFVPVTGPVVAQRVYLYVDFFQFLAINKKKSLIFDIK